MSPTGHAPPPSTSSPARPNRPAAVVTGDYACSACCYRISSFGTLPRCPMCGGHAWLVVVWRPFSGRSNLPVGDRIARP